MDYIHEIGKRAKSVSAQVQHLSQNQKNEGLRRVAEELENQKSYLMAENEKDIEKAEKDGMKASLIDRLRLTEERIAGMAEGLRQIADLEDPIGATLWEKVRPNGLRIGKRVVPLGVVGIIYESRPNVTADAFGLCFKTGNVVILRGGSDAIHSNLAVTKVIREGLKKCNLPEDAILLVKNTDRAVVNQMMKLNKYIDVLIPRGGAGLIANVVQNSTVPVIETGTGNCHIYVDETADFDMALDIIFNAKTQRISVCNSCESLLIHRKIAKDFLPLLKKRLDEKQVEIRADQESAAIVPDFKTATEEDWGMEYLDYILSVKQVDSVEDAIEHINRYNTGHSEAIITKDYDSSRKFLDGVDAAAVYVNASTRFTDGFEFGFGAEIGISTQKLHARGPMGLKELTTTKYIIYGSGQVRP